MFMEYKYGITDEKIRQFQKKQHKKKFYGTIKYIVVFLLQYPDNAFACE